MLSSNVMTNYNCLGLRLS